jgi:hypothetical protein
MSKWISVPALLVACGGVISSMAACPTKVVDNHTACSMYDSLPNTSWILVEIEFNVGNPDQQNTPEFKAKLRSWWDSLYLNFDLRSADQRDVRLNPPPDSSIGENTGYLVVKKSNIPAIALEDFITRVFLTYSITTRISKVPSHHNSTNNSQNVRYYDLTGRMLNPSRAFRSWREQEARPVSQTKP